MGRVFKIRNEKIFASFRFFFTQFAILQYFISQNHAKFQNFFTANLAVFQSFFMVKHANMQDMPNLQLSIEVKNFIMCYDRLQK